MSVYYHSLGRQLELRGAPTVLLPPVVRPLPLEYALDIIRADAAPRLHEVLWTMLRSTPPPPLELARAERLESYGLADPQPWKLRYPAPLRSFSEHIGFDLRAYDRTRARYRAESSLFAAALTAYARGERKAFKALRKAQEDEEAFGEAVARHGALGGQSPQQYLEDIADGDQARIAGELGRLQDDIGLSLQSLVNDFADCMAFLEILGDRRDSRYRIFPTSAVVIQDSRNLTTTVTVTTLVQAESRRLITETLDPQKWQEFSDAFQVVEYVRPVPTGFRAVAAPAAGEWGRAAGDILLREVVRIPSGLNPTVVARFENILRIVSHESSDTAGGGSATLTFNLYRSVSSRYLWDERPGGILVDQGYIKVRPLGNEKTWRVTVRKVLRFADRTPATWADTPLQFGQSLNYLAPAALSWWLQSDMYNAERYTHRKRAEEEAASYV